MFEINVWAQMFFNDGSVSEGIRVSADVFDDEKHACHQIADKLLQSTNRDEGFLLIWGAGEMFYRYYNLSSATSSEESDSLA